MMLTPEEEVDVLRDTVEACAVSFEKLAAQAVKKAETLREILADPEANAEEVEP